MRGIFRLFEGLAEVAPTAEAADGYRAPSLRVLPAGLATLKQSWMGEAGNAGRLRAELEGDPDLCDALDAMTGERTYCEAIPVEAAFTELERCSGTQFDPDVVAAVIAESGTPVPSPTAN